MPKERSFIEIDKHQLDEELVAQPGLYLDHAHALAEAEMDEDEAKAEFELTVAELASLVRADPKKHGITKPNPGEETVRAACMKMKSYRMVQAHYIKAKDAVRKLKAACRALEHKKSSLEGLVYLNGQSYFADRPAGPGARELKSKAQKRRTRLPARRGDDDDD